MSFFTSSTHRGLLHHALDRHLQSEAARLTLYCSFSLTELISFDERPCNTMLSELFCTFHREKKKFFFLVVNNSLHRVTCISPLHDNGVNYDVSNICLVFGARNFTSECPILYLLIKKYLTGNRLNEYRPMLYK